MDDAAAKAILQRFQQIRQRRMFTELNLFADGDFVESAPLSCLYLPNGTIYDRLTAGTAQRFAVIAAYTERGFDTAKLTQMRPLVVAGRLSLLPEGLCSRCSIDALFSVASCYSSEGLELLSEQCAMIATGGNDPVSTLRGKRASCWKRSIWQRRSLPAI